MPAALRLAVRVTGTSVSRLPTLDTRIFHEACQLIPLQPATPSESLTERSSLICAHNLHDALPLRVVRDAPTESASLRHGRSDTGRASALRLYPSRYISAAGSEDRALSLHTHTGLGLGASGRSTRIASSLHHDVAALLRRACGREVPPLGWDPRAC